MIPTIPSSTTLMAGIGVWSIPWFNEFLPLVYLIVGVFVAVGIAMLLIKVFKMFIHELHNDRVRDARINHAIMESEQGFWHGHRH